MEVLILYPDQYFIDEWELKKWAADKLEEEEGIIRAPAIISLDEAIDIIHEYTDITISTKRREYRDAGYGQPMIYEEWKVE